MAQLTNQQTISFNQQPVVIGQQQVPQNGGSLRGSGARYNMGRLIIVCGIVQVIIAIVLLCLNGGRYEYYVTRLDYVGLGIWNGVFAIIAGTFGANSRRKKCMVIAFMVLAIIATPMSAICCSFQGFQAAYVGPYYTGAYICYILICLAYALEILFCIIGASFTCVALDCNGTENQIQQVIVYQPYAFPTGQPNVMTPYTGVANMDAQPTPINMTTTNGAPPSYQFVTAQPFTMFKGN